MKSRFDNAARLVAACVAVFLACAMASCAGHAQAPSQGVFSAIQADLVPDIGAALEPATIRSRVVQVDTGQVTAARLGRETLRLNLFDDAVVRVRIDRVRPTRNGYFISGRPEGVAWGEVRLVVNGPVMVGTVVTPEGRFTIRFGSLGRHVIRQVDPSAEPTDHNTEDVPPAVSPPQAASVDGPPASIVRPATDVLQDQPTEDGSEVRVLVVYTPAFQAQQGGSAGMQALIDLLIQSANHAFEISEINPRLVLAHSALVNYVEEGVFTDYDRLQGADDGYLDGVHELRNEHAADLVHLLTRNVGGPAGVGGQLFAETLIYERKGFAVTADSIGTAIEDTFTHETGHNFGMNHDRYVDLRKLETSIYPYAFGYVNGRGLELGASATARWQTIMAYNDRCGAANVACSRLFRFANPDQTHNGDPLGVPADDPRTGIDGPADARLTINRTAPWVASYRSEACTAFTVSPQAPVASVDGGEVVLKVQTAPGCLWTTASQSSFLTPQSDLRHAGTGYMSISVEPNETGAERVGTLDVARQTIEVRQLAAEAGICSRTPAVVRAIAGDMSCDQIADQQLSQITELRIEDRGFTSLKAGDFDGLSGLQRLTLASRLLTALPDDLFSGLSELKYLALLFTQLSELRSGLFDGLSSLEVLRLDGNAHEELPVGLFAGLSNLRQLWLHGNRLEDLPPGLFADLASLEVLNLSSNSFAVLPERLFIGLNKLRELDLGDNQLTALPSRPFDELPELADLRLYRNQIAELRDDAFAGLPGLKRLDLSNNLVSSLPTGVFAGLSDVQELNISYGRLTSIPTGAFGGLANLERLYVADNQIRALPSDLFQGLSRLTSLSMGGNELTTLPDGLLSGLTSLKELDLQRNQFSRLPQGVFSRLTSLETLSLGGNPIDPLPLGLTLEKVGDNGFKAVAPTGAPFELSIAVSSMGGPIEGDARHVTIPAGAVESPPLGTTRAADTQGRVTVDLAALPELPDTHSGYVFEKDEALPLLVQPSIDPADAALGGLTLSEAMLDPAFSPDTNSYSSSVAYSVSSTTVALVTSNASATVAFRDEADAVLPDADSSADGHQVSLDVGQNVIRVEVTSENGASTRTYSVTLTRERNNCERTEQVLAAIMAAVRTTDSCDHLRNAHLGEIETLDVSGMQISALKSGDFEGLAGLTTLNLSDNQLAALPAGVFSELKDLGALWLVRNSLERLPDNVFSGLSELQLLQLQGNRLSSLPEGVFSGLSRLTVLDLRENRIGSLPSHVLSELSSLRSLDLSTNELRTLPADVFSGLSGLRVLRLLDNSLTSLPSGVFSGLSSLEELFLTGNDLETISEDQFSDLHMLRILWLNHNSLTSVPPGVFSELAELQSLHMSNNSLTALPDGLFVGLSNLAEVRLSANSVFPLALPVGLEKLDDSRFKAVVPVGAPFALELPLSVGNGGELAGGTGSIAISAGAAESSVLTVTRTAADVDAVAVDIVRLPVLPDEHSGYRLVRDPALPIDVAVSDVVRPPAQVSGVEVARGATSLRVSWTPVSDADGYEVQWKSGDEAYGDETRQAVVVGGDTVSYTITGLTAGTEYTVRVLATRAGADDGPFSEEVSGTTRSGDPDVNGDSVLDEDDAQIMYYAYRFGNLVGDGEMGGTEALRQRFLAGYSGLDDPSDEDLRGMVAKANAWRTEGLDEGGDINADGAIDGSDARAMYYAYTYASLLGDGKEGGSARFRMQLLGPLAGKADPTDEDLKAMLRRANELREAYGQ